MKKIIMMIALITAVSLSSIDAFCKDYIVPLSMKKVTPSTFPGIGAGDRLLVQAGSRRMLELEGLAGDAKNYIQVLNHGGQVLINGQNQDWIGIHISKSEYIHINGKGDSKYKYGFKITGATNSGIFARDLSRFIEINNLEIYGIPGKYSFTGISAREQQLKREFGGPVPDNWTMKGIYIHHNYVHDLEGNSGTYIGHNNEGDKKPYMEDVEIAYNIFINTGARATGLKTSELGKNSIHHNICKRNVKALGSVASKAAIILSHEAIADVYNNWIEDSYARGLEIDSPAGPSKIYNNVIVNTGLAKDEKYSEGMIIWAPSPGLEVNNNTIVNAMTFGIKAPYNYIGDIYNNIITSWGNGYEGIRQGGFKVYNNLVEMDIEKIGFVNYTSYDFKLTPESPAIDAGVKEGAPETDYEGLRVSNDEPIDAGAFQYNAQFVAAPILFIPKTN